MVAAQETPKEVWPLSPWARKVAQEAMDRRAAWEKREIEAYRKDLKTVHGQAVRDFEYFSHLIHGAFRFLEHLGRRPEGVAVDLGSGTGVGAAILSRYSFVHKVYAVEFSEGFVDHIMPLTFQQFQAETQKIVRVVGDFNRLRLPDASVGLVLSLDSLHHSEDLDVTLQEARRVLHPRGALIAVDRGWPDFYTDDQLNAMLDQELNENLKRKYGIPLDQPFTRRDFGEHEYRYRDWEAFFRRNGFELHLFRFWHPPALNRIWLRLPTFDWTVRWSAWRARRGARRHVLYGWGKKRILLVAIPQKGA